MAGKIPDKGQVREVLASLKGAWRRVTDRRVGATGPESAPEPAEQQAPVDDGVDTPADSGTPAETSAGALPVDDAPVEAEPAEAEPVSGSVEGEPVSEPVEAEPVAEPVEAEPVSEPLEVASEEAAKVVGAAKGQQPANPRRSPATRSATAGTAGISTGPSPFIAPASAESGPDASWTVAQLRALAKERGVRGYSSMSKAQLLGALNGPQA